MFLRLLQTMGRNVKMKSLNVKRQTKNQTLSRITPTPSWLHNQARSLQRASGECEIKCPCGFAARAGENDTLLRQRQAGNKAVQGEQSREGLHVSPWAHRPQRETCFCQNILQSMTKTVTDSSAGMSVYLSHKDYVSIDREKTNAKLQDKFQTTHGTKFWGESSVGWAQGEFYWNWWAGWLKSNPRKDRSTRR